MNIYKYIHYDLQSKTITEGEEIKSAFILSNTNLDLDYEILIDIHLIYSIYLPIDYLKKRQFIKNQVEGNWASLTNYEKDLTIDLYLQDDNTEAIIHLMTTKGLSQEDAISLIQDKYAEHVVKDAESCKARTQSKELTKAVISYLDPGEATDFLNVTEKLNQLYADRGVKGLNDGSYRSGLFDFIESTNDYTGYGLEEQGYTLLAGTYAEFKVALMNILREGNYGG